MTLSSVLSRTGDRPGGSARKTKEWVAQHAAVSASVPLADHHIRAWEWFEALESGARPPTLIECWPRGGGKSTTVELALARQAVKGERHFALYVSATQAAANRGYVQAVALTLEKLGIPRALNKYGHSLGWRPELLRTAHGRPAGAQLGPATLGGGYRYRQFGAHVTAVAITKLTIVYLIYRLRPAGYARSVAFFASSAR